MSWFKVDDGMLDHPKWKRAIRSGGDAALHLWLALGTWCSRHLTDGLVPADMLDEIAGPRGKRTRQRALDALISESLLVRHIDGSVLLHDYLDYNPSRADVEAERDRWARCKRKQRDTDDVHAGHSRESRASPGVPSRPVPSPDLTLLPGAEPNLTEPGTFTWLPKDWTAPEPLYGEAVMAGVTRAGLDEAVKYWRGRKLGGEWRSPEDFFRGKFASIRQREERERFKTHTNGSGRRVELPSEPGDGIDLDPRYLEVRLFDAISALGIGEPGSLAREWRREVIAAGTTKLDSKAARREFFRWAKQRKGVAA